MSSPSRSSVVSPATSEGAPGAWLETESQPWTAGGESGTADTDSPSTVKTMLERLYWKRSASGRVALVRTLLRSR